MDRVAVLSVHAISRNGLDAIGGIEVNGSEVDVDAPKPGEPRRGAPAESRDARQPAKHAYQSRGGLAQPE